MDSENVLNYPGKVDPPIGTPMGPDLLGRVWYVMGSVYVANTDKTEVYFELAQ